MATALNLAQPFGSAITKSFPYDNANYISVATWSGNIPAVASTTWAAGTATSVSGASFIQPVLAQATLKSLTVVPAVAPTAADQLTLTLYSLYAQAYGTATGAASPSLAGGTATSTSYNKLTFTNFTGTATNFLGIAVNSPVYNPMYVPISGAQKATVVVAGPGGTNTQANFNFATGPAGGIALNPGDIVVLAKGTDTTGVYAVSYEYSWSPGASFTL
jgi:hypothetical protein